MSVTRTVKGKRPKMYSQDGVDHLMAMTTALVQEVAVLRDRLDLVERIADSKGIVLADEIKTFELDQAALEERESWRLGYLGRIFAIFEQEAAELEAQESSEKYQKTLDEIAIG